MANFLHLFSLGIFVLFIYKCSILGRHLLIQMYPEQYLDKSQFPNRANVLPTCNTSFQLVRTIHNIDRFDEAAKIIKDSNYLEPILFKNIIKNPAKKWDAIFNEYQETEITFTEINIVDFGNMWVGGSIPGEKVTVKLKEFFERTENSDGNKTLFASFVKFVDPKYVADDSNDGFTQSTSIQADTNFLSNFPYDVLATPIHAAPIVNSYSLQYVGRKMWLFIPPQEMEQYDAVSTPATFLTKGNEADFFLRNVNYQNITTIILSSFIMRILNVYVFRHL
jgi:hypothetical protein